MYSVFVDRFNRPDSTNISTKVPMNVTYTEVTSDFEIVSSQLKAIGLTTHRATCDLSMDIADYYVQADVFTNASFASGIGLMLRYTDANNYYYARINTVSQNLKILKRVAGSETELGNFNGGYVGGTTYTLKFSAVGTTLKAFVNGTERISVTDSDITTSGKPGFFTDYGNSTFNNFIVVGEFTLPSLSIPANYSQPELPARGTGWFFNSIDMQVVTKSENWNQDQTKRLNEIQALKDLGTNYISVATPYDNYNKAKNYIDDLITKDQLAYHRRHWDAWEGDNSIPAGLSREHYLIGMYWDIVNNPELYRDGDLFGACVECSNANDHGNYTFRTPETSGGSFTFSKYNQFLKDQVAYANAAFAAIGKRVYTFPVSFSLSLLNLDGQILDSGDGGNSNGLGNDDIVDFFGGILTIDHYMSDAYRQNSGYGAKYKSDLQKLRLAFPKCTIMVGEWGYHTITSVTDSEQDFVYSEVIEVLRSLPYVIGVNWWVHMASNTASLFNDVGGTITLPGRLATQSISNIFNTYFHWTPISKPTAQTYVNINPKGKEQYG